MPRKYGHPIYGYGLIKDPHVVSHPNFELLKRTLGTVILPAQSNNLATGKLAKVKSQGPYSSCVGHGYSGGIESSMAIAGKPLSFQPSEVNIYRNARIMGRFPNLDGSLPPLVDQGSSGDLGAQGLTKWGITVSSPNPVYDSGNPNPRNSDCGTNVNDEPTLSELENENQNELTGQYVINSFGSQLITDIKTALTIHGDGTGNMVAMGIFCDTVGPRSVEGWDPTTGPLGTPDFSDQNGGGHWIYIFDYYSDVNGNTIFMWRNSWGEEWGNKGDGLGTTNWIANAGTGPYYVLSCQKASS